MLAIGGRQGLKVIWSRSCSRLEKRFEGVNLEASLNPNPNPNLNPNLKVEGLRLDLAKEIANREDVDLQAIMQ